MISRRRASAGTGAGVASCIFTENHVKTGFYHPLSREIKGLCVGFTVRVRKQCYVPLTLSLSLSRRPASRTTAALSARARSAAAQRPRP